MYDTDKERGQTLVIALKEKASDLVVYLYYGVFEEENVITRSLRVENCGKTDIVLEQCLSLCLDFQFGDYDLMTFCGRHAMERRPERNRIGSTKLEIGSVRGTSSHQYNPAVIVCNPDASEDFGDCYGLCFVYSGNFTASAQQDQRGQTRVVMGINPRQFSWILKEGETFWAPQVILGYSDCGFTKLSRQYHRILREHMCRGKYKSKKRPVLINNWEATYFDFDGEKILNIAREAAKLGIEMLVLDDGWFGRRDDDNSGLGDWKVNEKKLGCTLKELTERVRETGLSFGIWMEPEMVSKDSDLFREHPDWALQNPGRKPVMGRNQLVLDFSRKEVRDHVFTQICRVLDEGNIRYVKWDMNRSLSDFYSVNKGSGKVAYDYVLGVYDFMEKLLQKYPDILIEGCSGGGGRFDAGMLYYTPQIWCSDNTDALDRLQIQYGTSFFYPISTVGSHVSAVPNHQTGRNISLNTRAVVAMAGTFGYELDPAKLKGEEKEEIKEQVKRYRKYAGLINEGDYYRLTDPLKGLCAAWMFIDVKKEKILLNVVILESHGNMPVSYVKLKGLDADAVYEDADSKKCYFGSALMEAGLPMPVELKEYPAYQIELNKI